MTATNTLEDQVFIATPVIAAGELFLRGQNQLFCISQMKLESELYRNLRLITPALHWDRGRLARLNIA